MNCTNCGTPLPDGETYCANCGMFSSENVQPVYKTSFKLASDEPKPEQPEQPDLQNNYGSPYGSSPYQQNTYGMGGQNMMGASQQTFDEPYQTPYQTNISMPKTASAKTKIIASVVLLAVAACVVVFVLLGKTHDGDYKCYEMTYAGLTYNETYLKTMGADNIKLVIKGNKCKLSSGGFNMGTDSDWVNVSFKGDKVEFKDSYKTYVGTYDDDEKVISLTIPIEDTALSSDMVLRFKKE